jgi:two-component system chemotaxis response regulator CheY
MNALIIDDSRAARLILGQTLKGLGFEVTAAGTGHEGLEHLRGLPGWDVALVDWNLPDMDGLAFVAAVRADERFRRLPLVLVTGESNPAKLAAIPRAGANGHVMKPFTPETLRAELIRLGVIKASS